VIEPYHRGSLASQKSRRWRFIARQYAFAISAGCPPAPFMTKPAMSLIIAPLMS
jgi:hypothetical protein